MNKMADNLEGRRIILLKEARPTASDNGKAYAAVAPLLQAAGSAGVPYETVSAKARAAAPSVGQGFVSYMVRRGVFGIAPLLDRS